MKHTDRKQLLEVLDEMTDESFGYVLLALKQVVEQYEANHGFTRESTRNFVELAGAVNTAAGTDLIDMGPIREHNPRLFE